MVVMNRCSFELESPFPASEKIHEHFVLPEGKKTKAITRISHCLVPCMCGCKGLWVLRAYSGLTLCGAGFVD